MVIPRCRGIPAGIANGARRCRPGATRHRSRAAFAAGRSRMSLYTTASMAGMWRFPHYATHRPYYQLIEYAGWLRRLALMRRAERRAAAAIEELCSSPGPLFLFPLQLDCDYQVRVHSPFRAMHLAIEHVLTSFARHAPSAARLIVKLHPLDSGLVDWAAITGYLAVELGIADRLVILDGGDLGKLLARQAGRGHRQQHGRHPGACLRVAGHSARQGGLRHRRADLSGRARRFLEGADAARRRVVRRLPAGARRSLPDPRLVLQRSRAEARGRCRNRAARSHLCAGRPRCGDAAQPASRRRSPRPSRCDNAVRAARARAADARLRSALPRAGRSSRSRRLRHCVWRGATSSQSGKSAPSNGRCFRPACCRARCSSATARIPSPRPLSSITTVSSARARRCATGWRRSSATGCLSATAIPGGAGGAS